MEKYINANGFKAHFIGEIPEGWREMTDEEIQQEEITAEQEEINSRTITQRQLRLWLLRNKNISSANIESLMQGNQEALIEWEYASEFVRNHPMFNQIGALIGMTPADIDQMFLEAKEI